MITSAKNVEKLKLSGTADEDVKRWISLHTNAHTSIIQIVKKWKQSKCPPMEEWVNKNMVYLHKGILSTYKKQ